MTICIIYRMTSASNSSVPTNPEYLSDSIQCCTELTEESSKTEVVITKKKLVKGQNNDEQAEFVIGKKLSIPIHLFTNSELVI